MLIHNTSRCSIKKFINVFGFFRLESLSLASFSTTVKFPCARSAQTTLYTVHTIYNAHRSAYNTFHFSFGCFFFLFLLSLIIFFMFFLFLLFLYLNSVSFFSTFYALDFYCVRIFIFSTETVNIAYSPHDVFEVGEGPMFQWLDKLLMCNQRRWTELIMWMLCAPSLAATFGFDLSTNQLENCQNMFCTWW